MNTELLCAATKKVLDELKAERRVFDDHSWVESFQIKLCGRLRENAGHYNWKMEKIKSGRSEADRIDIYGSASNLPEWIIEIDATRSDQVAKKFLSRLALWGLKKNIEYVAILYPDTQKGQNSCKKFLRYGYDIIHKINSNSNIIGLFIDPNSCTIEVLDFKGRCHFDVNGHDCGSMNDAAAYALSLDLGKRPVTYDELKKYWGKYVSDSRGESRYKALELFTKDSSPRQIYSYTQFRKDGICSYWNDFVKKCKDKDIIVVQKRKLYDGVKKSRPFKYV